MTEQTEQEQVMQEAERLREEIPPADNMVGEATKVAERLERATAELNKTLQRQEALRVKQILGGKADAGKPKEKMEETASEYADKVLSGVYGQEE